METELLAIVSRPVNTIADVIASLESIEAALPDTDGLKWFNWLYLTVTRAVDTSVSAGSPSPSWRDPQWISQLDVVFAKLYLSALAQWLTPGGRAPGCWTILFDSRNDARLARIQFALAGMNAHIDRDLSVAVVQTCHQMGIIPAHLSPQYLDYCQVNDLLDGIIDQAKAQLLTGLLGNSLPSINLVENLVAMFGLRASREAAWTNSEMLWHAGQIPGLGDRFLSGLDDAATLAGRGLLAPVGV